MYDDMNDDIIFGVCWDTMEDFYGIWRIFSISTIFAKVFVIFILKVIPQFKIISHQNHKKQK
jgi:hypothetical protein